MALSDREGAEHDWGHARRELLVKEVVCFFRGCSVDLQSFEEVRKSKNLHQHVDRGLQEIPVANSLVVPLTSCPSKIAMNGTMKAPAAMALVTT